MTEQEMDLCGNCGRAVSREAKRCEHCGISFNLAAPEPQPTPETLEPRGCAMPGCCSAVERIVTLEKALEKAAAGLEQLHGYMPCDDCPNDVTGPEGDRCEGLALVRAALSGERPAQKEGQ